MSSSTSFSSDNLVDTLPTTNTVIDGAFLNELRVTPFLSTPRTPSPDKPLPFVPLFPPSLSSIDGSTRYSDSTLDSTLDSPSLRGRIDSLPPTPTLPAKNISTGLSKRTHALLEPHIPLRSSSEKSSLPPRSPLRPPARSLVLQVPTKDARHTAQDTPRPILRTNTTSFSIDNLVDTLPTTNIIVDGAFLNDKPRAPPFLSIPRAPSPDKALPIAPLSSSSPNSMDDSTLDSPSLRDPTGTLPPTPTLPAENISTGLPKRTHALLELIESERAYASYLALIRDIHLPFALGNEPPIPTPSESSSSICTLSNAPGSSATLLGPPMSRDDARIIFSNVPELAEFADDFVTRLEIALGNVLPSGEGEDRVGALFIETIPRMERPYMHYITRHPASLTHLNSLPQTPALAAYHATIRTLARQISNAWDLPSLLIKLVQHLLRYTLLLHAIIEATPDSHGDKENLRHAKSMVEAVLHAVNEGQRRREIVKEAFAVGKPAELLKKKGLRIVGRVRTDVATPRRISRTDSEENERVARMERQISLTDEFIQKFAKETLEWVKSMQTLMSVLRMWAEGFGRVIGLGPDVTSEAFDAFLVVVDKQLSALCIDLEVLVQDQLVPQLRILHDTIKRPTFLLETLHALEPYHYTLLQRNPAKGRPPPALNDASIAYVALRAQLCNELPAYVGLLHRGVALCVGQLAKWQARLWRDIRMRCSDLWDALRVEGEMNAGSEETERVWRARWEETATDLQTLNIIRLERPTPHLKQARAGASTAPPSPTATRIGAGSLETVRSAPSVTPSVVDSTASARRKRSFTSSATPPRLGRQPSTENLHAIRSAKSSSEHGHYADAPESPPRRTMARRSSMPMSLHQSSSHDKLADSFRRDGWEKDRDRDEVQSARGGATNGKQTPNSSLLPSVTRRNVGPRRARPSDAHHHPPSHAGHRYHPPVPSMPRLTVSSRWYRAPALYTCRVVHECDPPEHVEYFGHSFFKLFLDDIYDILKEVGHPSRHPDLPLVVDAGADCLLLARDMHGELGWLLASFMYPVD